MLITFASYVLGSLLFSSFISFSKYSFHFFNTASVFIITLLFLSFKIVSCCASFPALSLYLANLYNCFSFSFVSNLHTNFYTHVPLPSQLPSLPYSSFFFIHLFTFFIFYFVLCFLCLFLFFYALLNFFIPPPCLHVSLSPFCFPNVTPSSVSAVFLSISAALSHSSGNPRYLRLPKSWLPFAQMLLDGLSTSVSLSYLWLYFFCFFLFHHESHFAYHHTVLLCDALIYYYLAITHFF